jgi:DNA-binding CsgD family transcriptional regulator
MVPMLRERLDVSPRPSGDPEEDRWRLLDAAMDLLRAVASKQTVVVVLEDLHDADRGTLDLLLHVARNLRGTRLLLVGTYRDVDVDRAHPLAAALTELHRFSNVARVQLRGLSTDEVQQLLAETSQQAISQPFAELVHRQTEGNPLFVRETLRFVIDSGLMERRDGALRRVGDQSLAGRIPEGLRDAVGKRLSRLAAGTNRVLSLASVIGREFQLDVLSRVLAGPEDELEMALEEASAAGIIEERSVFGTTITYAFSHAFFRQTLYDEIVAPRRIRLHQQVARALEDVHRQRLDDHAAELAEHFAFSSDKLDLAKAVQYGEVAARRASDVFAYGEAARQLDHALVVQDLVDPDDRAKRCDLLLELGAALFPAGEIERVITRAAPDAFALAGALDDRGRAFRACRLALDSLFAQGALTSAAQSVFFTWAERATQYARGSERCLADLALARSQGARGQFQTARALRVEALALARQHGDAEALFRSANSLIPYDAPQHWGERLRLAEECAGWPRQGVSSQALGTVLWFCACVQLAEGQRARAEDLWRQLQELADRTRVVSVSLLVTQRDAALAILAGDLEEAVAHLGRFVQRSDESGAAVRGHQLSAMMLIAPALYLGRPDSWLAAVDDYVRAASLSGTGRPAMPTIVLTAASATCLTYLGRVHEARRLVGPLLDDVESSSDGELPIGALALLLQAAVALENRAAARVLAARLASVSHLAAGEGNLYFCMARHLGDAALLLDERSTARAYYEQALETAGKIRFRPELALTNLRLAELLFEEPDDAAQSNASEHLYIAIPELRDMHMQPALERGLKLLEQVERRTPVVASDPPASHALTGRERDVARLLAAGRSNRDIADALVITESTVEVHVKHILSKLGLKSRSQVAAWASDQRL